jgi:hypothetical protein
MVRGAAPGDAFVFDGLGADACLVVLRRLLNMSRRKQGYHEVSDRPRFDGYR